MVVLLTEIWPLHQMQPKHWSASRFFDIRFDGSQRNAIFIASAIKDLHISCIAFYVVHEKL